jgi:hypothetical protein
MKTCRSSRWRSVFWAAVCVIGLAPVLMLPAVPAHAGARLCKSRLTDSRDHERLREAILKVLPTGVPLTGGLPEVCRNRGSAVAWLTTSPRLSSNGVTEWWNVNCERGTRQWTCESPTHRQLIWVYAEIDDILRRLEVSFDEMTGLARARALAVRSVQIAQNLTGEPPPYCGTRTSDEDNRRDWEKARSEYRLQPKDTAVEISVESTEAGTFDVIRNGSFGLRFRNAGDAALSGEVCWTRWVVTT